MDINNTILTEKEYQSVPFELEIDDVIQSIKDTYSEIEKIEKKGVRPLKKKGSGAADKAAI